MVAIWCKGSHPPTQGAHRAFWCVCTDPRRTSGFCTAGGVLTCLLLAGGWPGMWLRSGGGWPGLVRLQKAPLSPRPLPYACGYLTQFFPHFS